VGTTLRAECFIEVERASLRARIVGEGPAVVLVHGWALDLDLWRPQIDLLADRYRVIAFDRRGFGRSSGMPSIQQDVLDLGRLLDELAISRAAVVGMSQGARVALRWALQYPEQVSCLVLDGPPGEGGSPSFGVQEIPIDEYRDRIRRDGIDAFRRMWLQHPYMQLHTSAPWAHRLLREMTGRYPATDLLTNALSDLPLLAERDLRRLDVPTLVLSGEHDSAQRRSIASWFVHALSDARLQVVPATGHLAALDDPGTYARALHDFFSNQPAMAAGAVI
jgi:3-oxoadipate enol-lactonase